MLLGAAETIVHASFVKLGFGLVTVGCLLNLLFYIINFGKCKIKKQPTNKISFEQHHRGFSWHKLYLLIYSKWFVRRSISSLSSVIVRVSVVLKRTVAESG